MAEKMLGLTESGREIKAPETELNLGTYGEYYQQQVPVETTFQKAATQQAETQFQKNVSDVKATAYKGASEIQAQGQEMQTQLSLGSYMREQSAEKAGWTGGYMLDQVRQGEFLKSTIQSQLYGAQELQKYGLDTQLEAARLAYDLGKEQLAFQYYNEAYARALQEAQLYGYYISPENRDMLNQYEAANNVLATGTEGTPEYTKALEIKNRIESFYGPEFSEADLRTFSTATLEMQQIMAGRFDAAMASIEDDPSKFLVKNADGTYATDANGNYITLDFDDITANDLVSYLTSDDSGTATSGAAVKSFLRQLGQETINSYLSSLGEDETGDSEGFLEWLSDNENNIENWINSLNLDPAQEAKLREDLGESINIRFSGPKGAINADFSLFGGTVEAGGQTGGANQETTGGNQLPDNPFRDVPEDTGSIGNGDVYYQNNQLVKWNSTNGTWTALNQEETNSYLSDYAKEYKDINGNKYNWAAYSNNTRAMRSTYDNPEPTDLKALWDDFNYDQMYNRAIESGDFSNLPDNMLEWREINRYLMRQAVDQKGDTTKKVIQKLFSKVLGVKEEDVEVTDYNPGGIFDGTHPSIKIKGDNIPFMGSYTGANEINGKYVFFTTIDRGYEGKNELKVIGKGVNDQIYRDGSGLNTKWLADKQGDYAYIIASILKDFKNNTGR